MFHILSLIHLKVNCLYQVGTNSDWYAFGIHRNRLILSKVISADLSHSYYVHYM